MSKRGIVAVLVVATGLLLCNSVTTIPMGVLLIGCGAYLFVLPYLGRPQPTVDHAGTHRGRL